MTFRKWQKNPQLFCKCSSAGRTGGCRGSTQNNANYQETRGLTRRCAGIYAQNMRIFRKSAAVKTVARGLLPVCAATCSSVRPRCRSVSDWCWLSTPKDHRRGGPLEKNSSEGGGGDWKERTGFWLVQLWRRAETGATELWLAPTESIYSQDSRVLKKHDNYFYFYFFYSVSIISICWLLTLVCSQTASVKVKLD